MSILPNKRHVIKIESAEKIARYFLGNERKDYPVVEIAVRQKKLNFYDDELAVITKDDFKTFYNYIIKLDENEFDSVEDLKYQMAQFHSVPKTPEEKPSAETVKNAEEILKEVEVDAAEEEEKKNPEGEKISKATVVIEEDLLKFFPNEKAVNKALRGLVELIPE